MVERACQDIHQFKKMMRLLPATEMERRMNGWVVEAAESILAYMRRCYQPVSLASHCKRKSTA